MITIVVANEGMTLKVLFVQEYSCSFIGVKVIHSKSSEQIVLGPYSE